MKKIKDFSKKTFINFFFNYCFPNTEIKGEGFNHWPYENLSSKNKKLVKKLYFDREQNNEKEYFSGLETSLRHKIEAIAYGTGKISFEIKNPKYLKSNLVPIEKIFSPEDCERIKSNF